MSPHKQPQMLTTSIRFNVKMSKKNRIYWSKYHQLCYTVASDQCMRAKLTFQNLKDSSGAVFSALGNISAGYGDTVLSWNKATSLQLRSTRQQTRADDRAAEQVEVEAGSMSVNGDRWYNRQSGSNFTVSSVCFHAVWSSSDSCLLPGQISYLIISRPL